MKSFALMESISFVEEDLLQECETAAYKRRPGVYKVILVAAIVALLSVTVLAAGRLFVKVQDGKVVPHTFHVQGLDAQWNVVYEEQREGYVLTADIATVSDAPVHLEKPYLPQIPENWECAGAANGKYDGKIGVFGISWTYEENGQQYEVSYRQESAYLYNTRGNGEVWSITDTPQDVAVRGKDATIGEASVYQVDVSESANTWSQPSYAHRLIFWSDGYSIFMLQVPQYWSQERIYELMCSLTLQEDIETVLNNLE